MTMSKDSENDSWEPEYSRVDDDDTTLTDISQSLTFSEGDNRVSIERRRLRAKLEREHREAIKRRRWRVRGWLGRLQKSRS